MKLIKLDKLKVQYLVRRQGFTLEGFAKNKLNITRQAFNDQLSRDSVTTRSINVIAKALDVEPSELLEK